MPMLPSPPPRFRMAGFPQYGFKAGISDRTCLNGRPVMPTPSIPVHASSFSLPFTRFQSAEIPDIRIQRLYAFGNRQGRMGRSWGAVDEEATDSPGLIFWAAAQQVRD